MLREGWNSEGSERFGVYGTVFCLYTTKGRTKFCKSLLSVLFFCLWDVTAPERKKGGRKREESERERYSKSCVPHKIANCPNLGN